MIGEPAAKTGSDITKEETVTNATLILETGTVDGTHKTDVVDYMTQTHHSTSTYPGDSRRHREGT